MQHLQRHSPLQWAFNLLRDEIKLIHTSQYLYLWPSSKCSSKSEHRDTTVSHTSAFTHIDRGITRVQATPQVQVQPCESDGM